MMHLYSLLSVLRGYELHTILIMIHTYAVRYPCKAANGQVQVPKISPLDPEVEAPYLVFHPTILLF